jgi:hypothetical protein
MTVVLVGIGIALIIVAIFDIFETLFDPEGQGRITDAVGWTVWKIAKGGPQALLSYAGPIAYIAVIGSWAFLLLTGWALIYWTQLPDAFIFDDGLDMEDVTGLITAYYVSVTTLSTLGYGDITPVPNWLRMLGPVQALLGFLLLTAGISWILAIYQDIEQRRSLAHDTTLLHESLTSLGIRVRDLEAGSIERMLDEVTSRLVLVSGSLNQFPITYFFRVTDDRQSLAVMALSLLEISEELEATELPLEARLRAKMLSRALDHFAETLSGSFVSVQENATTRDVLHAYARDHQRDIPGV